MGEIQAGGANLKGTYIFQEYRDSFSEEVMTKTELARGRMGGRERGKQISRWMKKHIPRPVPP